MSPSDDLIFMMGKFEARIPTDRSYSPNHLWLQRSDRGWRVGFTSYSVRLLQDVYFLEWDVDPGASVRHKDELGQIESSKALSTLYAPCDGVVVAFNQQLLDDPSAINVDNYGSGWLFELEADTETLSPEEYHKVLEDGWDETQRVLKGQLN